jgi:tRNA A-37 threonylcarbamoyl transferase component Bud32/tetratricopeptide (TPR) repeat protein
VSAPHDDELLEDLVARAMEAQDRDGRVDYERLCGTRWDLIDAVRESVESIAAVARGNDDPMSGRCFGGRYQLVQRLGAGAMGVVYRARDLELERHVAVKVLRAAILGEREAHARFEREAEVMAAIHHPSIAGIHDRGTTDDGDVFLVMELLDGISLVDLLDEAERRGDPGDDDTTWIRDYLDDANSIEPSYVRTAVAWTAALADGLQAAHDAGIVHRDVKPSNVFVRRNGVPVLLDFGIAARTDEGTLAEADRAMGTPAYMAPEVLTGSGSAGPAVDVYGLTATLYHLLTLRAPFRGTPSQVLHAVARREPRPAYQLRPGIPRDLQAVLDKGMARSTSARYGSARALAADLRSFLDYRPVTARPVTAATRMLRAAGRSTAVRAGVLVAMLAAAGIGGVFGYQALHRGWVRDYWQAWRQLPANTTLVKQSNRKVRDPGELAYITRVLDASVAACLRAVPTRAVRAAFRMDQGDLTGFRADMRAIADQVGSALTEQIAARCDELGAEATAADLSLAELPAPDGAQDLLLLAYLQLRTGGFDAAAQALSSPLLASDHAAEELRIFVQLARLGRAPDARAAGLALYERVARHEERLGTWTAQTAHVGAYALLKQQRYEDSYRCAVRGLDLSPYSYPMRLNAGLSARRCLMTEQAYEVLELARRLRPDYYKAYWNMFQTAIDVGDLDHAASVVASCQHLEADEDRRYLLIMQGILATRRALESHERGEPDDVRALSAKARDRFERADAIGAVSSTYWSIAKALQDGDASDTFRLLATDLAERPVAWRQLAELTRSMPEQLSADEVAAVRRLLATITEQLSRTGP